MIFYEKDIDLHNLVIQERDVMVLYIHDDIIMCKKISSTIEIMR